MRAGRVNQTVKLQVVKAKQQVKKDKALVLRETIDEGSFNL